MNESIKERFVNAYADRKMTNAFAKKGLKDTLRSTLYMMNYMNIYNKILGLNIFGMHQHM